MNCSILIILPAAISLGAASGLAWAAPEEIQVYMDEMNAPGEFGLDVHHNYVFSGSNAPDYPGAQTPAHVLRVTPEFSYGMTPNLELGAYVLASGQPGGHSAIDGHKLRLKYIAPKDPGQNYFLGANLEIGRVAHRIDENPWNGELKGILGYRTERWTFAINPNIDWKVSGPVSSPAAFELDSKISYKTDHDYRIGIETYNELGEIRRVSHLNQQSQTLYGVIDASMRGWDLNVGLGRGLSSASDRVILKLIVGVPIGK
ncbi:MAG TPA: hypothetical protein VKD04_03650 [Burkholderiales bacterium]|nr:hypothetical protein [Burkholderiales bacterium]